MRDFSHYRKAAEENRKRHQQKADEFWESLTEEQQEDAFHAVVSRIHLGEMTDRGSYRWVLYDVFGFSPAMYGRGMDCGYMSIHNCMFDGIEYSKMHSVNRLEVIDDTGRAYVNYFDGAVKYDLQDEDRTLKIFINNK